MNESSLHARPGSNRIFGPFKHTALVSEGLSAADVWTLAEDRLRGANPDTASVLKIARLSTLDWTFVKIWHWPNGIESSTDKTPKNWEQSWWSSHGS